ncbi:unnamed protein product [Adineta ricciae]|uniref:EGF-like domain-containing protein n=1 Tax=Adineta ricciae TaxID=249248 RepID=A0A813Q9R9_ADIRI|nr:unnamed protein product [Adineta ricciae]
MTRKTYFGCPCPPTVSFLRRLGSALFYATCSSLITIVNKLVLTTYGFPSFQLLAVGQLTVTVFVLYLARSFNLIRFPHFSENVVNKIMPLPIFFFGNLLFGLASTQAISLPMFTVLRRFSIWLTMIGEQLILRQTQSLSAQASVYLMLLGAVIAVSDDLTFNWSGYIFLIMNNFSTAAQGIVIKRKLVNKDFNQNGLLFYNSFVVLGPAVILTFLTEDLTKVWNYDRYSDMGFIIAFLFSSLMGFLLNYSTMLCTNYNSPLTTTVVGACKNMFVTYLGMLIGGDYIYSHVNFIGLNISVIGSIIYSWVTFTRKSSVTVPHGNDSSTATLENRKTVHNIFLGFTFATNVVTQTTTAPTTFMGYTVNYTDIDPYSCLSTTTVTVSTDTTTICLTTTQEPTTTVSTTITVAATTVAATTAATTTADATTVATTTAADTTIVTTESPSTKQTSTEVTTTITTTTTQSNNITTTTVTSTGSAFIISKCANQTLGPSCNVSSSICNMAQPCLNLATCFPNTSMPLGYVCTCQVGYTGANCEIDNTSCSSNSVCLSGGSCNSTANETTCKCPVGKTGSHCEYETNVCANITCQNDGLCVSKYGNWSCVCTNSDLYSGTYCEYKSSSLRAKEVVSRSFACVAIGCISTVIAFIIIMDILKYGFKVNPAGSEIQTWREKKRLQRRAMRRQGERSRKKKIDNPRMHASAVRFNYINA